MQVLRTSDERFSGLTDWPFEPHYVDIDSIDGASLRLQEDAPEQLYQLIDALLRR